MNYILNKWNVVFVFSLLSINPAWAASTETTKSIQGSVPVLIAPSNGARNAVDFSGIFANPGHLSTGDTIVLTYEFSDPDGDEDYSISTINWSYTPYNGGPDVAIKAKNDLASGTDNTGTSTITIPSGALGAQAIKVVIQEQAATGLPLKGEVINVTDTSLITSPGGGGGGGTHVTPPGPVMIGKGVAGGIFLLADAPTAGSGAIDYSRTANHPQIGQTYVFRAWSDENGDGIWDAGETDMTSTMKIQWKLDGINNAANGTEAVVTLSDHSIVGATTDTYTLPVNSASTSGAKPGDQGFSLKVDFE